MYDQIKTRFVSFLIALITVFTLIPAVSAFATDVQDSGVQNADVMDATTTTGSADSTDAKNVAETQSSLDSYGWAQISYATNVYRWGDLTEKIGSVSAGEGVTVLYCNDSIAEIDYSSSASGHKNGYVPISSLRTYGPVDGTSYGLVTTASSTYYDPYFYNTAGSVSIGEYVAVLSKEGGMSYIEYNVSGGKRKQAFIPSRCINDCGDYVRGNYISHPMNRINTYTFSGSATVYAGPDSQYYSSIGSISNEEISSYWEEKDRNGNPMAFILYYTANGSPKCGWIQHSHT